MFGQLILLHSFRHGFAVRRLLAWYAGNLDVRALIPHLSVYLGHLSKEETYWYLTATPELLTAAGEAFRRSCIHFDCKPSDLTLDDLPAKAIVRFLDAIEQDRGNSVQTRNARLAAIRSFFGW